MPISIYDLEQTVDDFLVQIELLNGEQYSFIIQPANKNAVVPMEYTVMDAINGYVSLGIKHILFEMAQ